MKKLFIGLSLAFGLFACGDNQETAENPLVFSTSIDNLQGWTKLSKNIQSEVSHSGIWAAYTSKKMPYSYGLEIPFQLIPSSNIKKVKVSAWVYKEGKNDKSSIAVEIRDKEDKFLFNGYHDIVKVPFEDKKWTKIEHVFDFGNVNTSDGAYTKIYFWNSDADETSKLYIDDYRVEFLEQ
ncbi:MAG: hypothetical protein GY827_02110 [Cytophagales bacterium]|nr:hypothetical protein [Cytophagales bacterium]